MAIGKMVPKDLSDGRVAETFNLSKKKKKERKKEKEKMQYLQSAIEQNPRK